MGKIKILVAPLNWGLGHATRCIPIINSLTEEGFDPVIASDGAALNLLKAEFPYLEHYQLPSYNITYSKKSSHLKWKLFQQTPHIFKTIAKERKTTTALVKELNISGIISDNRWGVISSFVPSAFMTHQLKVLSGSATFFSTKIQHHYIKQFDECWIPDAEDEPNLSGKMGHGEKPPVPLKYLGILSRFTKETPPPLYDVLVVLSGPEPQREMLENIIFSELKKSEYKVILVRGVFEKEQEKVTTNNICCYNFLTSSELEFYLNRSRIVICRAGYTGIMDLVKLKKKAILIPTPGQYEQEYLAKRLMEKGWFYSCRQEDFSLDLIEKVPDPVNLPDVISRGFARAFALFQGK